MVEIGQGLYARALERFRTEFMPTNYGKTFNSDDVYKFFEISRKPNATEIKRALRQLLYNLSNKNNFK